MPTRNVSLTPQQDEFIEEMLRAGVYQNASECMRDGLRLVQNRRRIHEQHLQALKDAIQVGIDQYNRGDYVQLTDENFDEFVDEIDAEVDALT